MDEGYKIVKKWVDDLNFEILVLQIPDGDIEDKLTGLAGSQGNIGKEAYYQFLMIQCVANVQQLAHAVQLALKSTEYEKVKLEIVGFILEVNPKLDPEKLVVNKNGVIKLAAGKKTKEGERRLTDNKLWNAPSEPQSKDYNAYRVGPEGYVSGNQTPPKELEFVTIKKWWKRLNIYVEIRQYKENELLPRIVNEKRVEKIFFDEASFRTFVVTTCVVDSGTLFSNLDSEGISGRVSPIKLMQELYLLGMIWREKNGFVLRTCLH